MYSPIKVLLPLMWLFASHLAHATTSLSDTKPLFVAVMGDSVALGVWADAPLGTPGPRFYVTAAEAQLEAAMLSAFTGTRIDDLSDAEKYSTTLDHYFGYIARKPFSALIGKQEYSLPGRIKRATGKDIELFDTSFLAGCYRLSSIHLQRLRDFMTKHPGHKAPDFIVVNFSAMDFVFNSSLERFEADLRAFYQQVTTDFPHTTIIVNPLVDVVTSMSTSFDEVAVPIPLKPMTCAENYERIGFGSQIGMKKGITEEELNILHDKLNTMNDMIAAEVAAMEARVAPYNEFSGRAIEQESFQPAEGSLWRDYLSADCIHPNIKGQRGFSELVWAAVRDQLPL